MIVCHTKSQIDNHNRLEAKFIVQTIVPVRKLLKKDISGLE